MNKSVIDMVEDLGAEDFLEAVVVFGKMADSFKEAGFEVSEDGLYEVYEYLGGK